MISEAQKITNEDNITDDPLYVIFEKTLYDYKDSNDETVFITEVITEYFNYLKYLKVSIPHQLVQSIRDELEHQIRIMLLKKTYGCMSLDEYHKSSRFSEDDRKTANSKYNKLF